MELIGRRAELDEVAERLRSRRLVTVVGPAGIGKTALARAVADRVVGGYPSGAQHVDLTRVERADAVAGALAGQLGFASFEALLSAPSAQPALLVLDNCEHVTAAAADAVDALLSAGASLTVLATSRSPLGLRDESIVPLGPLALPRDDDAGDDGPAVQLFLERAKDAGARLSDADLAAVVALCRQLDGLPLALELAAARCRVLHPAEISQRLDESVDVLARPRFRGDERHRSLGATIDWSCRTLPPEAAAVLFRLSVLAGPFTEDLAVAVAGDLGLDAFEAAATLDLLVDSSLVVSEPAPDGLRLRLLQTVRTYATDQLRQRGELEEARRAIGDHVVSAAARLLAVGGQRWDPQTFGRLVLLYDTIASTLRWCIDHDDEPDRALMLCSVLWGLAHQGHTEEIAALCEGALARWPDPDLDFAADAAATLATARSLLGDQAGALELAERALAHTGGSRTAPVTLRRAIAVAARAGGDAARALRAFEEMGSIAVANGVPSLAMEADVGRAQLLADDDPAEARRLAAGARAAAAEAGSTLNELWARTIEARLLMADDLAAGTELADAVLAECERIGYPVGISVGLRSLAWASLRGGDAPGAAGTLRRLLDGIAVRSGVADLGGALAMTAEVLYAAGDEAWRPVAASARALPVMGMAGGAIDGGLPDHGATPPLSRRDVLALARRALGRVARGDPVPPDGEAPAASTTPSRFVVAGDVVELAFAGRAAQVRTSKGLVDLARLLAEPGREIHCLELAGGAVEQGDVGPAVDATARREYEARIRELHDDVAEAEAANDFARAERAQVELDAIVDHLTAALGLRGRGRLTGASAERARSTVTQRIRSAIRRLAGSHPELARHLEVSVVTGTWCCYRPERPVVWETDGLTS